MNKITEVTRRAIFDLLTLDEHPWYGRLSEVEFLSRVFDLEDLPSTDSRFSTASGDISQHTVNNPGDWEYDWAFYDSRFNLLRGPDDNFLRFLCEMVHPVVRPNPDEATGLVRMINEHLTKDGWEIAEAMRISDKSVYAARPLLAGTGVSVEAAKEVALTLDAGYISQQITRMESAINSDPELAIGTAKEFIETICKTILTERQVSYEKGINLPKLVNTTLGVLELVPAQIASAKEAADSVRILLKNLASTGHHLAELRNPFGTGHGKPAHHQNLNPRHARLAVGAASTLGVFLFECHTQQNEDQNS